MREFLMDIRMTFRNTPKRLDRDIRGEKIKTAVNLLTKAEVLEKVHSSNAKTPLLRTGAQCKFFKLLFLDIGLLHHALMNLQSFVIGIETDAEVDYLVQHEGAPALIEVKSGSRGTLKSLRIYIEEFGCERAFVLSQRNVEQMEETCFLPLYFASRLGV